MPPSVARELVDARLIMPVLDGLDEIRILEHRHACVAGIDAYAERGEPHRPFVLTCRTREYRELAPDWVRVDECVVLVGLQRAQIKQRLKTQTTGRPGWDVLRERQAAGEKAINELFASPLRLAIALQVYRNDDPSELLKLTIDQARGGYGSCCLRPNASYRDAPPAQVRGWLTWLAASLHHTGKQRFMLHQLYLLDVQSRTTAFRVVSVLSYGLATGLFIGLFGGLIGGLINGLVAALLGGLFCGLAVGHHFDPAPLVRRQLTWRARMRQAWTRENLLGGLAVGVLGGLTTWLAAWLATGLVTGLFLLLFCVLASALFAVVLEMAVAGTEVVGADLSFVNPKPDAILIASRSSWLVLGVAGGLIGALFFGLAVGLLLGPVAGLALGLATALAFGLLGGLREWAYHYWLRWRLRARGALPARLPSFLERCADDERSWLRISDAYEFRHGELLEHLAPQSRPAAPSQDGT